MQEFFRRKIRPRNSHLVSSIIERKRALNLDYFPTLHDFPNKDLLQEEKARKTSRNLEESVLRSTNQILIPLKHIELVLKEVISTWPNNFDVRCSFDAINNCDLSIETDVFLRPMFLEDLLDELRRYFRLNEPQNETMTAAELAFQLPKSLPKYYKTDYEPPDWVFRDGFYRVKIRKPDLKSLEFRIDDITITIRVFGIDEAEESRRFEDISKKTPFATLVLYSLKRCVAIFREKGPQFALKSDELDLLRSSLECLTEDELESVKVLTEPYQSFIEDMNLIRLLPKKEEKMYCNCTVSVLADLDDSTRPTISHCCDYHSHYCLVDNNDINLIRHNVEQQQTVLHKPSQILSSYGPTSQSDVIGKEDLEMTLDLSKLIYLFSLVNSLRRPDAPRFICKYDFERTSPRRILR